MCKQFIVKRTVTVNLLHFVAVIIHAHIQQSAYMASKCNMKLVILDSNANPDAALSENVHTLCNVMKNVKPTKIDTKNPVTENTRILTFSICPIIVSAPRTGLSLTLKPSFV